MKNQKEWMAGRVAARQRARRRLAAAFKKRGVDPDSFHTTPTRDAFTVCGPAGARVVLTWIGLTKLWRVLFPKNKIC